MNRTKGRSIGDVLFASDDKEINPSLEVMAVTNGYTGRFAGSGRKLSLAPMTTSVAFFIELLKHQLKT